MRKLRFATIIFFIFLLATSLGAKADDGKLARIRCTCYCHSGITASGKYTRPGIIAGKKECLGKTAALYRCDEGGCAGDFIGYFEILDTGDGIDTDGDGRGDSIKRGKSIDVYRPSLQECRDWIAKYGDYVYFEIIDAEG